jgi:hypothetical protein
MKFIEISGKSLSRVLSDDELHPDDLAKLGVTDESVLRINRQATSNSAAPTAGT